MSVSKYNSVNKQMDVVIFPIEDGQKKEKGKLYYIISLLLLLQTVFTIWRSYNVVTRFSFNYIISHLPDSLGILSAFILPEFIPFIGFVLFLLVRKWGWILVCFFNVSSVIFVIIDIVKLVIRNGPWNTDKGSIIANSVMNASKLLVILFIFSFQIMHSYSISRKIMVITGIVSIIGGVLFEFFVLYLTKHILKH